MIFAHIFFYVFAIVLDRLGDHGGDVAQPGSFRVVPDPLLLQRRRLFLIAGAEFLALILLIVYVGAVAVLFLFVVMMLDIDFSELRAGVQRYAPIGAVIGAILLVELAWCSAAGRSRRRRPACG